MTWGFLVKSKSVSQGLRGPGGLLGARLLPPVDFILRLLRMGGPRPPRFPWAESAGAAALSPRSLMGECCVHSPLPSHPLSPHSRTHRLLPHAAPALHPGAFSGVHHPYSLCSPLVLTSRDWLIKTKGKENCHLYQLYAQCASLVICPDDGLV